MLRIPNKFLGFYSIIDGMMKLIALIASYIVLCLRLLSPDGVHAIKRIRRDETSCHDTLIQKPM